MRLILIAGLLSLVIVGCGHKKSPTVLHLRDGDITEDSMRSALRVELRSNPLGGAFACKAYKGLSLDEAVAVYKSIPQTPEANPTPDARVTPKPGQQQDPESTRRFIAILQEECKAIS